MGTLIAVAAYAGCWLSSSLGLFYFQLEETDIYESSPPTVTVAGVQVGAHAHGRTLGSGPLWYLPLVRAQRRGPATLLMVLLYDESRGAQRYRVNSARALAAQADEGMPLFLVGRYVTGDCVAPGQWARFWRTTGYAGHIAFEPDWMGVAEHGFECDAQDFPRPTLEALGDRFQVVLDLSVETGDARRDGEARLELVRRRSSRLVVRTLLDTLASMG